MIQGRLLVHMAAGRRLYVLKQDGTPATLYTDITGATPAADHMITANERGTATAYCTGQVKLVEVATASIVRDTVDVFPLKLSPVTLGATGVDDTAYLQSAITVGGETIELTADTPTFVSAATMLTAGGTKIQGIGPGIVWTVTEQSATGTSFVVDMTADGLEVKDTELVFAKAQAGVSTTVFLSPDFDNVVFSGLSIEGNTALASGTQDRSIQIVSASTTNDVAGLRYDSCYGNNIGRVYTRTNANAASQKRIKATFNSWQNTWRTHYTFNAPSGSIEDVLVIGDTFDTHAGVAQSDSGVAGNHNAVGLVGVRGGRVIGNHVSGPYGAVAHIEENTDGAVILGNTARMRNAASTDAVLECLANNIGGSTVVPKHVAWIANVLQSTDGVGKGAYLQSQASGDALQWGLVTQNIIDGYDEAYRVDTDARSVLVTGNVLKGVTNAAEMTRASLLFDRNVVKVVAEPIHVTRGGMIGAVHYANLDSATGGITAFGASAGGPLVLTEWTWETSLFAIDTGTTYLDIGPMPTRAYGTFSIVLSFNASIHRHLEVLFEYDGATITNTTRITYGSGSITSLAPANNAGKLAVTLTNGGAATAASARIQVRFHSGQFIV